MADIKTQVQSFVNELPVSEESKQSLLQKFNQEGPTVDLMVEIKMALVEAQVKLDQDYKPQLDQLENLLEEEKKQLSEAYSEYSKEMDGVEEDAENLDKAIAKAEHEQDLQDARSKISS